MSKNKIEERGLIISEFRYGIIADLANPFLDAYATNRLIYEKSLREYDIPFSSKRTITAKTIRNWLKAYLKFGKSGLYPKIRSDYGKSKAAA